MQLNKMIKTTSNIVGVISLAAAGTLAVGLPAKAFTLGFNGYYGSSNSTATGASARLDFNFSDVGDGTVRLDIDIANTTDNADYQQGIDNSGANGAKLVGLGFDFNPGDINNYFDLSFAADNTDTIFSHLFDDTTKAKDLTISGRAADNLSGQDANGNDYNSKFAGEKFGVFDSGLGFQSDLMGSGSPQGALIEGQSTTVSLILDIKDGFGLTNAASVENLFESRLAQDTFRAVARFKNVNQGAGSDKLFGGDLNEYDNYVAEIGGNTILVEETGGLSLNEEPVPVDIPEPGTTVALIAFALGGAKFRRQARG